MRRRKLAASWSAAALLGVLLAAPRPALAEPANGFGAYLGLVAHAYAARFSNSNVVTHYESAGLGVVGDMQFVINPEWSLNPSLALSAESVFGDLTGTASNGVAAIQARRWFGDDYVAAHIGAYVTLLSTGSQSGTNYGVGGGVAVGRERPDGWTYGVVVDFPVLTAIQGGAWLNLGYRWR